jgi:multiple epidermal growth factor-like domains protein 10/11
MGNCKIAIVSMLLAMSHLAMANDQLAIIGDELEGPNVCKKIDKYNVTVVVAEMVPFQETKMVWCAKFPPRCPKTEIKLRQVNKTQTLEKARAIRECCEGYVENSQRNRCIPHCVKPCINGKCAAPNQCKCDSGYGGPSCDISELLATEKVFFI